MSAERKTSATLTTLTGIDDERLLRVKDVAGILQIHASSAYELIVTGKMGDFHRISEKAIRIKAGVVRTYIESTKRPFPTSSPFAKRKAAAS